MNRFFGILGLFALLNAPVWAQDNPAAPPDDAATPATAPVATARVVNVDEAGFANLANQRPRAGAISLRVSAAAFEANPAARDALANWVGAGNVVFLHTGAADFFGFQTVEAREGSNARGGQLFGRARAALPFGANPLLWDDGRPNRRNDPTQFPGVNLVFYQMQPGDSLVVGGNNVTPLLQVTDLAGDNRQPLFAAAMAPYGRGWAIFTPDSVDQKRADGALFARNLLSFVPGARGSLWVSLGSDAIQSGADEIVAALQRNMAASGAGSAPPLPGLGEADAPAPALPKMQPMLAKVPALMLARSEVKAIVDNLDKGGLNLLRARYALQSGDFAGADQNLQAIQNPALSAEVAFVSGCLNASAADDVTVASPLRARSAEAAARDFAAAANVATPASAPTDATGAANPATQRRNWSVYFNTVSQIFGAEPPLAQTLGSGDGAITVRYFPDDPSLTLVQPAAQTLSRTGAFGWQSSREELLLFPSPQLYANYRRGSGLTMQNVPLPAAAVGDVVGQRIIMASVPTTPIVFIDPRTKLPRLVPRTAGATIFSRLQAYVLLNAWSDGSGRIPAWFALGLENLASQTIDGNAGDALNGDTLQRYAQAGGLLSPNQFKNVNSNSDIGRAQSASLLAYFYQTFGAGAVTETVQQLGAGSSIDNALLATTESDETGFFTNWRNAQFGPQRFPNQG